MVKHGVDSPCLVYLDANDQALEREEDSELEGEEDLGYLPEDERSLECLNRSPNSSMEEEDDTPLSNTQDSSQEASEDADSGKFTLVEARYKPRSHNI